MSRFRPAGFRNGRTAWRRASRRDSGRPGTVRWHRATDLPLPPTVKRRSAGRPPPIGETAFRGAAGFREARRDAVHPSRNALLRARVLEVRIHLPPANGPSLAGFLLPISKSPAVAAACAGPARRHGRQRRAGLVNIMPTAGDISVGPYSSTAVLPMWFATVPALARSEVWLPRGVTISVSFSAQQLRQSRARSAARASQVADVNVPTACLRSDRAADRHRGWPR